MRRLLLASLVLASSSASQTPHPLAPVFAAGVRAQLDGRHDAAQAEYEKIAQGGLRNAEVEYNLGTSYAESNELGRAVLHLRRSQFLRPAPDAERNLELVRERVVASRPPGNRESSLVAEAADRLAHWPIEWALCVAAVLFSGLLAWTHVPARPPRAALRLGTLGAAAVAIMLATLVGVRAYVYRQRPAAVMLIAASAKEGPDERFRTTLELAPGEEVRLSAGEAAPGFACVHLPGGRRGFVPASSVEKVVDWQ